MISLTLKLSWQLVVFGGEKTEEKEDEFDNEETVCTDVFMLRNGTWTEMASMQKPRVEFTACAMPDGRVAIAGGMEELEDLEPAAFMATVEVLDIEKNEWSDLPDMAQARTTPHLVAVGGTLKVLGGQGERLEWGTRGDLLVSCEQLKAGADAWTELGDMPGMQVEFHYRDIFDRMARLVRGSIVLIARDKSSQEAKPPALVHVYDDEAERWFSSGALMTEYGGMF